MRVNVLIGITAGLVVFAVTAWRVHAMHARPLSHVSIIEDLSGSHPGGCSSVLGIAEQIFDKHAVLPGSSLTVLAVGDESTANEPRLLARYPIPVTRRIIEGAGAAIKQQQEILDDLKPRCGKLQPTMVSPIFQGVKQAVAELRSLGCRNGSDCKLWIDSDLEENAITAIQAILTDPKSKRQPLPASLANDGIHIAFCGWALTAGRIIDPSGREIRTVRPRDPNHDDNLRRTWAKLFTNPELLTFDPYCPEPLRSHMQDLNPIP